MASGTVSSTSTYVEGNEFNFAKSVAGKVLNAAIAAKGVKKTHDAMERRGETIPEAEKKGVFSRALKEQFVDNPIKGLKKSLGTKIAAGANIIGLFGKKGRATERNILAASKKYLKVKVKRKNFVPKSPDKNSAESGEASGGSSSSTALINGLGSIVLDIEQIATSMSNITSLFNNGMGLTYKIGGGLEEIKDILSEQLSIQKSSIEDDETRAREAALENSQQNSGTAASTSTIGEGGGLLGMFGDLKNLLGMLKSLPEMIGGFIKSMISKLPGGAKLIETLGGAKKAVAGGIDAVQAGGKGLLKGVLKALKPGLKAIPFGIGGLLDFGLNMLLGEPPGKAAAKAIGSTIGSSLGALVAGALGLVGGPAALATGAAGAVLGGIIGDTLGGAVYDLFAPKKMSEGGVMVGESGPEMITPLDSAMGKSALSGGGVQDAYNQPYNAVAGGMLAVTRDFVEGLGPIGSSVAPIIQDDVDRLSRVFDIPATNTTIQVGGASVSSNPLAEKEGKKYMEDLISGSLEKIAPKKENKESSSSGSSPSSTPTPTGDPTEDPSTSPTGSPAGSPAGAPAGAPTPKAPVTAESFSKEQLEKTKLVRTTTKADGITTTADIINNKNLQQVGGGLQGSANKYYYDGFGTIYAIDKDELRKLSKDEIKKGGPGSILGSYNFYRDLNTGRVNLATDVDARTPGWYDYAQNAVREQSMSVDKNSPSQSVNSRTAWVSVGSSKYANQFTKATPYGKSKIKAESGISVTSNSGDSNKQMLPGKTYGYKDLNPHHSDSGMNRTYNGINVGEPKDYGMGVLPRYMPDPASPNGKVPIPVSGKVLIKEWNKKLGYGRTVIVETSLGKMQFSHLSKFGSFQVGDQLSAGTLIGVQGGSGNRGEKDYDEHLHLNASKNGHEAFVNFITSGKATTGSLGEDGKTDPSRSEDSESVPEDPFEAMEKGIKALSSAIGVSAGVSSGLIKTKEDFAAAKTNYDKVANDKATSPEHFRATPSGSSPSSSAFAVPTRAASPTAAATATLGKTIQPKSAFAVLPVAGGAGAAQPIPSERPDATPASMSGNSYPSGTASNLYNSQLAFLAG